MEHFSHAASGQILAFLRIGLIAATGGILDSIHEPDC